MKAITVRQPWAWAIFHGKDVENRSRWTYKHRGETAIHAGAMLGDRASFREVSSLSRDPLPDLGMPRSPVEAAVGAVLGTVDLVDVHWWEDCAEASEDRRGKWPRLCSVWAQRDQWHLVLRSPRTLVAPIARHGKLGVWDFS